MTEDVLEAAVAVWAHHIERVRPAVERWHMDMDRECGIEPRTLDKRQVVWFLLALGIKRMEELEQLFSRHATTQEVSDAR
jgi:hypothetical protein